MKGIFDFLIEGPSPTEIDFQNYGQGIGLVTFTPKTAGQYLISIKREGGEIEQTYTSTVIEASDVVATKVENLDFEPIVREEATFRKVRSFISFRSL